jgi:NAD(P)-dependent dehydrogenase (short-subunit alcohol dehydrogenase family)
MRAIAETTVLVTGATDGLGRAVARRLAELGATVHVHGRDRGRLQAAASTIGAATGRPPQAHLADFAALDEVRALADEVRAGTDRLHVLINNAGIGAGRPDLTTRQESSDGYELRFAVNHLAGFLLTVRLLGLLRASAPARIVNVVSLGQHPIDFDDVMLRRGYDGWRAYGQSKLAQVMAGFELAERLSDAGVAVNSLHPGTYMPTKMVLEQVGHTVDSLETGVEATVRLAVAPELEGITGRFFDRRAPARADPQAYDRDDRRRLWELSLALTGEPEAPFGGLS